MSEYQKYTPREIRRQHRIIHILKGGSVGAGLIGAYESALMTHDFMANSWTGGAYRLGLTLWFGGIALKSSCMSEEAKAELYNMENNQTEPPLDEL